MFKTATTGQDKAAIFDLVALVEGAGDAGLPIPTAVDYLSRNSGKTAAKHIIRNALDRGHVATNARFMLVLPQRTIDNMNV